MHEWFAPPVPTGLVPYLDRIHGYRMDGYAPGTHIGMPSPSVTLVVTLGEAIMVSRPGAEPRAYNALVGGLHREPAGIHHDGSMHGIELDLTPAGVRALLGCPAAELTNEVVELCELLAPVDRSLPERAAEQTSWSARFDLVLRALTRRLPEARAPKPEVAHAWDEIRRTHGTVPVWAVASSVGWSRRHLGEQFRREYGIGPKIASRLARFDRSRELMRVGDAGLAAIATRCGYADQAHLTREWHEFTGTTPVRWPTEDALAYTAD